MMSKAATSVKFEIGIPSSMVNQFKSTFKETIGREASEKDVLKFFKSDIIGVYRDSFEEGLEDAIESYFEV